MNMRNIGFFVYSFLKLFFFVFKNKENKENTKTIFVFQFFCSENTKNKNSFQKTPKIVFFCVFKNCSQNQFSNNRKQTYPK